MTARVPTEWSPSAVGVSAVASRCISAPISRPRWTASSMSRTDAGRAAVSGTTACGKTTAARSGRIPTMSGIG
jgi:hypothetical protein